MQKWTDRAKKCVPYLFLIIIPVLNFWLLEWFSHDPFQTMKPYVQWLNVALFWFSALFLFGLTGRVSRALGIQTAFCAVYGLANYFVLEFRGAPIQPWDILSIGTAASVADNYEYRLDKDALTALIGLLVLLAAEFFLRADFYGPFKSRRALKKEAAAGSAPKAAPPERTPTKRRRVIIARTALCLVTGLLCFGYTKMLHNEDFVQKKLRLYDKLFTPTTIQFKNGTVTAFLMELQYMSVEKPSGYNEKDAREALASYETAGTPANTPNIIVVMNEAFSDPAVLGGFTTNEDYMPFVHSLLRGAEDTVSGLLNVSVKGGNTANTEFEYLTGNSMAFLPYGSIPYQQYIKNETPSMASWLSGFGYRTVAMHPYRAAGWDRNKVYPLMGFDEMYFEEFYKDSEVIRKYVSDEADYEKIIQIYEQKEPGEPLFLFNVTMQNHSSYNDWADYDNFSPDITVDGSDSEVLSAYLSLMKLSDQATERLVDYFAKEEEDTVIVFFGDHQPTDSVVNPVLKLNGTSSSSLSAEEEALRYQVPFFIWANYDIEEESGLNISANYLASRTLDAAGLPKPGYFSFLSELEKQAPVISANHVSLSDGTFSSADDQDELLREYKTFQYHQLFD
ncbi:MAG: LTA synthase family protein [Firmicutes bacterium]|nr:LTA synthase family protein [Bacillota bacterium]